MFKVVITDYIGPEVEPEKALIGDLAEIVCLRARSVAELERRVEDVDAIIIFHEVTLPGELIDRPRELPGDCPRRSRVRCSGLSPGRRARHPGLQRAGLWSG